ncbi:MAG: hypothetical protein QM645_04110 [Asticcacaulis sp.]
MTDDKFLSVDVSPEIIKITVSDPSLMDSAYYEVKSINSFKSYSDVIHNTLLINRHDTFITIEPRPDTVSLLWHASLISFMDLVERFPVGKKEPLTTKELRNCVSMISFRVHTTFEHMQFLHDDR